MFGGVNVLEEVDGTWEEVATDDASEHAVKIALLWDNVFEDSFVCCQLPARVPAGVAVGVAEAEGGAGRGGAEGSQGQPESAFQASFALARAPLVGLYACGHGDHVQGVDGGFDLAHIVRIKVGLARLRSQEGAGK